MSAAASARNRWTVDDRRAQFLRLGMEHFGTRPYDDISIGDIAKAAGVSKGLLYHYFPSKRALYVAVTRAAADTLMAATEEVVQAADGLSEQTLLAGLDAYLAFVQGRSSSYVFLMRSGLGKDPEVLDVVEEVRSRFVERIAEVALATAPAPAHPRLLLVIRGWIGFVEAASLDWVEGQQMSRRKLAEMLIAGFMAALASVLGNP